MRLNWDTEKNVIVNCEGIQFKVKRPIWRYVRHECGKIGGKARMIEAESANGGNRIAGEPGEIREQRFERAMRL